MNLQSYFATFGMVALSVVTVGGCTVNTTTDNGDAADNTDTGTGTTQQDTGTAVDTGAVMDSGTTPGVDADASAASCSVALDTGSTACDTCVGTSCCTQLTNCVATDDAGTDDAGNSACLQLLVCINDVNAASDASVDAGTGESTCNPSYTTTEQSTAEAVLTCIRTSCSAQCPGL